LATSKAANPTAREDLAKIEKNSSSGAEESAAILEQKRIAAANQQKQAAQQASAASQPLSPNLQSAGAAAAKFAAAMQTAADATERAAKASDGLHLPAPSSSTSIGFGGGGATPPVTPSSGGYSFGGVVPQYFDSGGLAKGIDTIAAQLAPGERVIDQRNSAKFFSQLQSISAGVDPTASRGTSGDTFNFGDINVNGAGNPKTTAREVINAIRREQRRGSGYPVNQSS